MRRVCKYSLVSTFAFSDFPAPAWLTTRSRALHLTWALGGIRTTILVLGFGSYERGSTFFARVCGCGNVYFDGTTLRLYHSIGKPLTRTKYPMLLVDHYLFEHHHMRDSPTQARTSNFPARTG